MHRKILIVVASTALTLACASAWAQEGDAVEADAVEPASTAAEDGPRYRWGVALSAGLENVSVVSGFMGGLDVRLGVQANDWLGFYAQSHLSLGSLTGSTGGFTVTGFTGTFSVAGMAELIFLDRFFAGAGFGYGMLNSPSGPMLQARLGAYPLWSRVENSIRRMGLMVGVDFRTIFISGATGILVLGTIGYEKF